MRKISLIALPLALLVVTIGCVNTAGNASLWAQARAYGENRVFHATVGGKTKRAVWTSAVDHPEHKARHQAHQRGLRLLGNRARDVDVRVVHRSDGQCRVDMLMTAP